MKTSDAIKGISLQRIFARLNFTRGQKDYCRRQFFKKPDVDFVNTRHLKPSDLMRLALEFKKLKAQAAFLEGYFSDLTDKIKLNGTKQEKIKKLKDKLSQK